MPTDMGINFRQALDGSITDPANTTYSLGESYPTTRASATFGWDADLTLATGLDQVRNRSVDVDDRLGGIAFQSNAAVQRKFRLDTPGPGTYDVYLAIGDHAAARPEQHVSVLNSDGTTVLFTVTVTGGTVAGEYADANGTEFTAANWPASNTARSVTLSGSSIWLRIGATGSPGDLTCVAHFRAVQTAAAGGGAAVARRPLRQMRNRAITRM